MALFRDRGGVRPPASWRLSRELRGVGKGAYAAYTAAQQMVTDDPNQPQPQLVADVYRGIHEGIKELKNKDLSPTALSAQVTPGGAPLGLAVAFGDTGPVDPGVCVIKVQPRGRSLLDQVAVGDQLLATARLHHGQAPPAIRVLAASGAPRDAQECFTEALRQTLQQLPEGALLIADTPASGVPHLADALNATDRQLDLVLSRPDANGIGPSLWPVATKRVVEGDSLSFWHRTRGGVEPLIEMAQRARRLSQRDQAAREDMADLLERISPGTHLTSDQFEKALGELSGADPWAPDGLPTTILTVDDQKTGARRAPYVLIGVGNPVTADQFELVVANDRGVPPQGVLERVLGAHGDDIRNGTGAVAMLFGGVPVVRSTVDYAHELLRGYNPHLAINTTAVGEIPERLPRPTLRAVAQGVRGSQVAEDVRAGFSHVLDSVRPRRR